MRISLSSFLTILISSCFLTHAYVQAQVHTVENKKEVTASELCHVLNDIADADAHHLYNEKMGTDSNAACIERVIKSGKFYYEVIAGREDLPVKYVSEQGKDFFVKEVEREVFEQGTFAHNRQEDFSTSERADEGFLASNRDIFYIVFSDKTEETSLDLSLFPQGLNTCVAAAIGVFLIQLFFSGQPIYEESMVIEGNFGTVHERIPGVVRNEQGRTGPDTRGGKSSGVERGHNELIPLIADDGKDSSI